MAKSKNITTMQLALMTAAAVISLRGLPMMAQEELTMFFYIFFATFLFLIPAALVGAELGSAFASRGGGVYSWVKEAFNPHLGFTAIFLHPTLRKTAFSSDSSRSLCTGSPHG